MKSSRNCTFANSQRKSTCAVCDEVLIYKNLTKHFSIFHPNETVKEKPPQGTRSVQAFFVNADKENHPPLSSSDLNENEIQSEEAVSVHENEGEYEKIHSNGGENVLLEFSNSDKSEIISKLSVIHEKIIDLENMHKNDDLIQVLNDKMQNILENVERLHVGSTFKAQKLNVSAIYDVRDLDSACAATSIDDIMDRLSNWKLHFSNETSKGQAIPDGLYCTFCSTEISQLQALTGVIRYDFSYGDNFKRAKTLPREFRNLKLKVKAHMECSYHADKVIEKLNLEKIRRSQDFLTKNEKAGMACARNAYKAIYSNHSHLSYEVEIAKDAANNVEVGELNHSFEFCSYMVDCFYNCLIARFRNQIFLPLKGTGRPSPVTFIFDKYTPMHRTLNIIAANMYTCGSLETVFLDCPVVKHHDAEGLAKNLSCSVAKVYGNDDWKRSYCGSSADGQMILLGYGAYLNNMVSPNGSEFFSHIWDAGHLVELANKDSTDKNQWVSDITSKVTEVTKNFKYGKQLEELIEIQHESNPDGKLYAPRSFSTTRWATYCHTTLSSFLNNYPYYYDHLQRNQLDITDKINTVDFVVKCAVLTDVYNQIGILSRTLQSPNLYFWHLDRALIITCDNLFEMSDKLRNEYFPCSDLKNVSSPHSEELLLRCTGEAVLEISTLFTYKSKPLLNKQHLPTLTRQSAAQPKYQDQNEALLRCRRLAADFIDSLIEALQSRMEVNSSEILTSASKAFDLQEIYRREEGSQDGLDAFIKYAETAIKVNFLEPYTLDELKVQYTEFQTFVREEKVDWYDNSSFSKKREFENKLYNKLMHNTSNYPEVNHLLASSTVRLANESQCESIGSVVGRHYEHRGSLKVEKVSKEVFTAWNGPPPFHQCNTLLKDALHLRFGGGPETWHFLRVTRRTDLLKTFLFESSKVVDRLNRVHSRIDYNYDCY